MEKLPKKIITNDGSLDYATFTNRPKTLGCLGRLVIAVIRLIKSLIR